MADNKMPDQRAVKVDHEARLYQLCQREDLLGASGEILSLYGAEVQRWLLAVVRSEELAAQIYRAFWARVISRVLAFSWDTSFRAWAYTQARKTKTEYMEHPSTREDLEQAYRALEPDIVDQIELHIEQAFAAPQTFIKVARPRKQDTGSGDDQQASAAQQEPPPAAADDAYLEQDQPLLELYRAGQLTALGQQINDRHGDEILSWLMAIMRDRDQAWEIYQMFWVNVMTKIKSFRWEQGIRAWAYTQAKSAKSTYLRQNRRPQEQVQQYDTLEPELATNIEARASSTFLELQTQLEDAYVRIRHQLPLEQQEILLLKQNRNFSWAEVVQIMEQQDHPVDPADNRVVNLRKAFEALKRTIRDLAEQEGLHSPDKMQRELTRKQQELDQLNLDLRQLAHQGQQPAQKQRDRASELRARIDQLKQRLPLAQQMARLKEQAKAKKKRMRRE